MNFEDEQLGNRTSVLPDCNTDSDDFCSCLSFSLCMLVFHFRRVLDPRENIWAASEAVSHLCCQLLSHEISPESLVEDTRYFHELGHVLFFTCDTLAHFSDETAVALIRSITKQVKKGDGIAVRLAFKCIEQCEVQIMGARHRELTLIKLYLRTKQLVSRAHKGCYVNNVKKRSHDKKSSKALSFSFSSFPLLLFSSARGVGSGGV